MNGTDPGRTGVRRVWTARVSADAHPRDQDGARRLPETLTELARAASEAAEASAREATRAAHLASQASVLSWGEPPDVEVDVERLDANLERARSTVLDIAQSAAEASAAAAEARDQSYLTRIAAEFDPSWGEPSEDLEKQSQTDSASDRD